MFSVTWPAHDRSWTKAAPLRFVSKPMRRVVVAIHLLDKHEPATESAEETITYSPLKTGCRYLDQVRMTFSRRNRWLLTQRVHVPEPFELLLRLDEALEL